MADFIETIIIGGGQAGLAVSYFLNQNNSEHIILEQAPQVGDAWRNHKWDSFALVTPNWMIKMPGAEYQGSNPDGFFSRSEIVKYFEQYIEHYKLPVHFNVQVTSVELKNGVYLVKTNKGNYNAANVVIATGSFQQPRILPFASQLSQDILQFHSSEYFNPEMLPPGGVLIIGSAESGCQIAEELYQDGRKVFLSIGSTGRLPRRYRDKDVMWWLNEAGFFDRTVEMLRSPQEKFIGYPQLSGKDGGHTLNLYQFLRDGVVLLGHLRDIQGNKIFLVNDVKESLHKVDKYERNTLKYIDETIKRKGINAPKEDIPKQHDGHLIELITELDLKAAGITNLIWATGYKFDYRLVKLSVFDEDGYPIQDRGVSSFPGLYFIGLSWLHKNKSALLFGIGEDAEFIARNIMERKLK